MKFNTRIESFPAFCGGRVITGFPMDTVLTRAKCETKAGTGRPGCDSCEVTFKADGSYVYRRSVECDASPEAAMKRFDKLIAIHEDTILANRAGIVFATLNSYQEESRKLLFARKWKQTHEFINPNTGHRVYTLAKLLV